MACANGVSITNVTHSSRKTRVVESTGLLSGVGYVFVASISHKKSKKVVVGCVDSVTYFYEGVFPCGTEGHYVRRWAR